MDNSEKPRICKECRFSYRANGIHEPTNYYCKRLPTYNIVFGKVFSACEYLRKYEGQCGREGKYWMPRLTLFERFKNWIGWMG